MSTHKKIIKKNTHIKNSTADHRMILKSLLMGYKERNHFDEKYIYMKNYLFSPHHIVF